MYVGKSTDRIDSLRVEKELEQQQKSKGSSPAELQRLRSRVLSGHEGVAGMTTCEYEEVRADMSRAGQDTDTIFVDAPAFVGKSVKEMLGSEEEEDEEEESEEKEEGEGPKKKGKKCKQEDEASAAGDQDDDPSEKGGRGSQSKYWDRANAVSRAARGFEEGLESLESQLVKVKEGVASASKLVDSLPKRQAEKLENEKQIMWHRAEAITKVLEGSEVDFQACRLSDCVES